MKVNVVALQRRLLPHDDLGADGDAVVEIGDVGIDQPEAAGRNGGADRVRPVGAVNAIHGGAEVERAGAERVAGTAGHEARQIGLARDHLRRRGPVRPFRLARNRQQALPLKAVAADADAVAYGAAVALHDVEMALRGLDDDGPRCLRGAVQHHGASEFRIELDRIVGDKAGLIAGVVLLRKALRGGEYQARGDYEYLHHQLGHRDSFRAIADVSITESVEWAKAPLRRAHHLDLNAGLEWWARRRTRSRPRLCPPYGPSAALSRAL